MRLLLLILWVVVWSLLWDSIFFWFLTRLEKKKQQEEETKEPIFMGEDENGNWTISYDIYSGNMNTKDSKCLAGRFLISFE